MSDEKPLCVLSIAHTGVQRDAGRLRYHPLGQRSDLEVHLVVPKRWFEFGRWYEADAPDDPGIHVHVLPIWFPRASLASWYLHFYPGLGSLIRKIKPDIIHLWEEPWSIVALQACALRKNAAYVLEVDQNIQKHLVFPFESLRRFVLRKTDHVLVRSSDATAVVRACGYTGPVTDLGYGVDQRTFSPVKKSDDSAPPMDTLRLGYVGRLIEEKGIDDAIDALAKLPETVTLAIMGEGPYAGHMKARIKSLGLESRVTFQGWDSPKAVAEFIRSLDILVLLTRTTGSVREQFGRVILEAQSCGVPVLGSQCGSIPLVIGAGGWIVPEKSPLSIVQCIESILKNPNELRVCREAGLANIGLRFTFRVVAETLATVWRTAYFARKNKQTT